MVHSRLSSLLAVLCCAATAARADEGGKSPPSSTVPQELQILTRNALAYGVLEVSKYWSGEERATLNKVSNAHPIVPTWWALHSEKPAGLEPDSIERITFVVPRYGEFVAVVTTTGTLDHKKVLSALTHGAEPEVRNGREYFTNSSGSMFAFSMNRSSFAVGSAGSAELVLNPESSTAAVHLREELAKTVLQRPLLVAHCNVPSLELAPHRVPDEFQPLPRARSWQIRFEPTERGLSALFEATFADGAAAKESVAALDTVLRLLDQYLALAETNMPPFLEQQSGEFPRAPELAGPMKSAIAAARSAAQLARASQSGASAQVTVLVETEEPVTAAVLLLSLMPRPPKDADLDAPK